MSEFKQEFTKVMIMFVDGTQQTFPKCKDVKYCIDETLEFTQIDDNGVEGETVIVWQQIRGFVLV